MVIKLKKTRDKLRERYIKLRTEKKQRIKEQEENKELMEAVREEKGRLEADGNSSARDRSPNDSVLSGLSGISHRVDSQTAVILLSHIIIN